MLIRLPQVWKITLHRLKALILSLGPVLTVERPLAVLHGEPKRLMVKTARLHILPSHSLHLLDSMLLQLGLLHLAVLQTTLIRPKTGVGRRQLALQILGEFVEFNGESRESVIKMRVLWHRTFFVIFNLI